MKVLHVLDHSLPIFSGYSFRSANIVRFQKAMGIDPLVLTSPKHGSCINEFEEIDGVRYFRTAVSPEISINNLPFIREVRLMRQLRARIAEVSREVKVDLIHS